MRALESAEKRRLLAAVGIGVALLAVVVVVVVVVATVAEIPLSGAAFYRRNQIRWARMDPARFLSIFVVLVLVVPFIIVVVL